MGMAGYRTGEAAAVRGRGNHEGCPYGAVSGTGWLREEFVGRGRSFVVVKDSALRSE